MRPLEKTMSVLVTGLGVGSCHHFSGDRIGVAANGSFQLVAHLYIGIEEGLGVFAALPDPY